MPNPFKPDDEVYHIEYGLVRISVYTSEDGCGICPLNGPYFGYHFHASIKCLSFDPWPEPNHVRPTDK